VRVAKREAEIGVAQLRFGMTLDGSRPIVEFASRLVDDRHDEQAKEMLVSGMRAVVAIRVALARGDAGRAHRLLDRLDGRLEQLAAYCEQRQEEIVSPDKAKQLARENGERLARLARSGPAIAAVIRERRSAIDAARQRFARYAGRVPAGCDLVRTLLAQVRSARTPRAHAPPGGRSADRPRSADDDAALDPPGRAGRLGAERPS
jgi:hypothetical protein